MTCPLFGAAFAVAVLGWTEIEAVRLVPAYPILAAPRLSHMRFVPRYVRHFFVGHHRRPIPGLDRNRAAAAAEPPVTTLTPITPRQVWLALVVVCTFSYISYLAQRYWAAAAGGLWMAALSGL